VAELTCLLEDEAATAQLAAAIAELAQPGWLVFLEGPLAAGKTSFARAFLRALGHLGKVKSPTFTVVESYALPRLTVHHFDLYRINDPDELHYLGFDDFVHGTAVCLIEWPSRAADSLPTPDLRLTLTPLSLAQRRVQLETGNPILLKALEQSPIISFLSSR